MHRRMSDASIAECLRDSHETREEVVAILKAWNVCSVESKAALDARWARPEHGPGHLTLESFQAVV